MSCPICASTFATPFARWSDFSVLNCRACGFRFVDTSAPEYPEDAQRAHDQGDIGLLRPWLPHIQRRVADILRYKRPPGRLLDIGCGKGELTVALHETGFACTGIDMKARVIEQLQAQYPAVSWHRAVTGDLAAMTERFDVLVMYHVLEHVSNPREVLASVKRLANPGALVVIEVPNVGGWEARLKRRRWHYYKVDHVGYYRRSDVYRLAADLDLTVLAVRGYQHFSHPQSVWWKDVIKGGLGRLGFQDVMSVFLRAN